MSFLLLFDDMIEAPADPPSEITGRLFLAWGNLADEAMLSGGAAMATLPLANLKIRNQARVWRSPSLALEDTQFDVDLGRAKVWRVFSLVRHNLALDATYRLRAGNDPTFAETLFDSGWTDVWPPGVFDTMDLEWGDDNFLFGRYTEAQRQGLKWSLIVRPPRHVTARYARLEISDPNNAASYVQAARLFIANGWSPSVGMSFDASFGLSDASEIQQTYAGDEVFNEKLRKRLANFVLNGLPEGEAYSRAFQLMKQAGITKEVLFMWRDDDVALALERQFLARLDQLSPIDHPYPEHTGAAFAVKEL